MSFTSSGVVKGCIISLFLGILVFGGLRSLGYLGRGGAPDDPAVLARAATDALAAVKRRQPGERRPASYDSVMAPLDQLLKQAKALLESPSYNPQADFEKIRMRTVPVIDIATDADRQAKSETGPLAKEYRFNDQKGEACQYLASALWQRLVAGQSRTPRPLGQGSEPLPQAGLDEVKKVLETGLEATPGNRQLHYIRGVVYRAEGLFPLAARDLELAITIDPSYAAAWNTLGLVYISLKDFDKAEEALEKARTLELEHAKMANAEPGEEYTTTLYNLASFHEGLAAYYSRENRITPTVESRRLLEKHTSDARKYFEEFLKREPSDSPDAKAALSRLNSLPR